MGRKKLLSRLAEFFDMDDRSIHHKKDELNLLLSRLKLKETELKESLKTESDQEVCENLSQKIDVVHSQRKKGIRMLKELKKDSGNNKSTAS